MYHFIGIKGSGMSALAQIMYELGYQVQGSDYEKHFFTQVELEKLGIKILPFDSNNIKKDMIIIKGAAFSEDHEEVKKAKELGLEIYTYSEMVGKLTKQFQTICIAGCHGKTTTTSMISHILNNIVGCNYLIGDGTGFAGKNNKIFALESCEYRRHFLSYYPYYTIITNIDLDHVDYFKDIDDVIDAYQAFANKTKKIIIACGDDPICRKLKSIKPIVYYGTSENNDIRAINIQYNKTGIKFDVMIKDTYYGTYDIPTYGEHNLLNALAVITVCYYENIDFNEIAQVFKTYTSAKRRFSETIVGDSIIIDDYAHHPNEIKATLNATFQKYPGKKIIAIFQPHTYSRTQEFEKDFILELNKADETYLLDIHGAREKQEDYPNVTSKNIINSLKNGHHINLNDAKLLAKHDPAVFVFMSPNDISKLENDLIQILKEK